jgi:hypothetical protein
MKKPEYYTCFIGLKDKHSTDLWCIAHNKKAGECTHHSILEFKYKKLLEFVKESDYIDSTIEELEINSKITDDSYLRLQSEYILQLKQVLKEIGEL